jgi:hypothetical protein
MTVTLELPAEVESALEAKAARLGLRADELARRVVSDFAHAPEPEPFAEEKRRAAVRSLRGMLAGGTRTVDDFLRERHEESDREEAAYQQRSAQRQGQREQAA